MPGLTLFSGNRLEDLASRLALILTQPPASPLDREIIVVQSKGMERWVSMELARHHGICANCRFPFPNALVDEVFHRILGALPEPSPFDPDVMVWRIMGLLPSCVTQPGFEILQNYLASDPGQLKQFQLSRRIADLFDQYLLFRPEMIMAWEKGLEDSGDWQPGLWRELARGREALHRAALRESLLNNLQRRSEPPPGLPPRLTIFGISSLPPLHMEIFKNLARFIPINLFLMNPCREYWGEIRSEQEMGRITGHLARTDIAPEDLYLEQGNSLLASLGVLGRDFFHLVQDAVGETHDLFREPEGDSLLESIQADILHLTERDSESRALIDRKDVSIVFHSCHSPMREIEVLYDQLLALFQEETDLAPKDVLVMTPDINVYAPFIQAVFESPEQPSQKIPYSITDRSMRTENRISGVLLTLLDMVGSRLGAPQVLGLLQSSAVRRRFGLTEADLPLIHRWVIDTRIRWGADAQSREALGFGAFEENSWRAGLDRLLLGYALPGAEERTFHGVFPYDHIEGSDAAVLGSFLDFAQSLFAELEALARPRTLDLWAATLTRLLGNFFAPDSEGEKEALSLRQVLNDLSAKQQAAQFADPVPLEVIRAYLGRRLETETMGMGFLTGGVTFCAMLPMRSIPFEVIWLTGMDDGAFPRRNRAPSFDLMAQSPRLGDRSQRNDDRYLFLEALLSARRRFVVSSVGQSQDDNSPLPPSILVSELMDVIRKGYKLDQDDDVVEHLTTHHRLQPFSPSYFKPDVPKLFSYSAENCHAVRESASMRMPPRPFISSKIGEPEQEWRRTDLTQLAAFFSHPCRFLLNKRLQIQLEVRESAPEDREAFELDYLEQYLLAEDLLHRKISGQDPAAHYPMVRASGRLPHGAVGVCRYGLVSASVETFYSLVEPFVEAGELPDQDLALTFPPFEISGRISHLTPKGLVHYRSAKVKAKDRLSLWLRHLILNTLSPSPCPPESFLVGKDTSLVYSPVDDARQVIHALLGLYWEGLQRPLHFFPQSSYAYAQKRVEGRPREEALKAARNEWKPAFVSGRPGEGEDPYLRLCFREQDPLDQEFEELALEVYGPLCSCENAM